MENLIWFKLLLVCLVGSASFYMIYILQGMNAALLLISQNLFTITFLAFLIDVVRKPEKIVEHINNHMKRRRLKNNKKKVGT
jgi:uncharacterized membrane protein